MDSLHMTDDTFDAEEQALRKWCIERAIECEAYATGIGEGRQGDNQVIETATSFLDWVTTGKAPEVEIVHQQNGELVDFSVVENLPPFTKPGE